MTNFCQTARQIGDTEKDQELKELLENADITGRDLIFDEFYEIMKNDKEPYRSYKKIKPKNDNLYTNKYTRKYYGKQEKEEPSEKNSKRSSYRNKKSTENNDNEPKGYNYKRVKVEQTKNNCENLLSFKLRKKQL